MRDKLRLDLIKGLKPRETRYSIWDTEDRGLGLEVLPGGGRTWWYRYSRFGKPDKVRLGSYPSLTLDAAKKKVRSLKGRPQGYLWGRANPQHHCSPCREVHSGTCSGPEGHYPEHV
jgi:hypothetical protein